MHPKLLLTIRKLLQPFSRFSIYRLRLFSRHWRHIRRHVLRLQIGHVCLVQIEANTGMFAGTVGTNWIRLPGHAEHGRVDTGGHGSGWVWRRVFGVAADEWIQMMQLGRLEKVALAREEGALKAWRRVQQGIAIASVQRCVMPFKKLKRNWNQSHY